jgi:hypothetical protein
MAEVHAFLSRATVRNVCIVHQHIGVLCDAADRLESDLRSVVVVDVGATLTSPRASSSDAMRRASAPPARTSRTSLPASSNALAVKAQCVGDVLSVLCGCCVRRTGTR